MGVRNFLNGYNNHVDSLWLRWTVEPSALKYLSLLWLVISFLMYYLTVIVLWISKCCAQESDAEMKRSIESQKRDEESRTTGIFAGGQKLCSTLLEVCAQLLLLTSAIMVCIGYLLLAISLTWAYDMVCKSRQASPNQESIEATSNTVEVKV